MMKTLSAKSQNGTNQMNRIKGISMRRYLIVGTAILATVLAPAGLGLSGCTKSSENKAAAPAAQATGQRAPIRSDNNKSTAIKASSELDKSGEKKVDGKESEETAVTLTPDEVRTAGIQVTALTLQKLSGQVRVTAMIEANQDALAHIAPRVAGRIVRVQANLGDVVKAGQALAVLDSIDLGDARSAYRTAQTELSLARANFNRLDGLYREQVIAQKDWLAAHADYEKAKSVSRAAADKLRLLGVAPGGDGSTFPVTAPFAGMVIEKNAVLGELAPADQSLFTVANLSTVWIESDLYEKDLGGIQVGAPAQVRIAAYSNTVFEGRLTYISSTVDPQTHTVKGRIEVPNPRLALKPGMFANVTLVGGNQVEGWAVPETAIILFKGEPSVFRAEGNRFEPQAVQTGAYVNGYVVIRSGLKTGDRVVTAGAYQLKARLMKSSIGDSD